MHQALYRIWRPGIFDDVVGQEHITTTLKNEIAAGRPAHAYLFIGSRGTGKTTCARIVAKAVSCLNAQNGNPCGECEMCRGIDNGSLVDVVEIDAASNNGVDNIRDLREEANFLPNAAKYRVYIIDEVHMLSVSAFNALLKILEEPPSHVLFVLATTEVHKVPATILSRCQRFDFRRIDSGVIAGRLQQVAEGEGFRLEEEAAMLIARMADGGMRDALSIMDLCSSYNRDITVDTVSQATGLVAQDYLFKLAEAAHACNTGEFLELVGQAGQSYVEYDRLCEQLIGHYRNLMV
ncbi:MAG: DNA polymerase III subunit gamma/tau, partial [Oscillospiraceae bacterium]|nr:DNA polymerase III subunit gamma/tau [Oscillospiraceae bacterium]